MVHVPVVLDSARPCCTVPEMAGSPVFTGAGSLTIVVVMFALL